jgi:hypothetical protein
MDFLSTEEDPMVCEQNFWNIDKGIGSSNIERVSGT